MEHRGRVRHPGERTHHIASAGTHIIALMPISDGRGTPVSALLRTPASFAIINGLRTFAFRSREELIEHAIAVPTILIALNAEKMAQPSRELRRLVNQHVGYADGAGATLALRRKGLRAVRIPGAELWLDIVRRYAGQRRFYLLGGTDDVIGEAVQRLQAQFPYLLITGYRNGYLRPDDVTTVIADLKKQDPEIVLVAMGSPRQELLMERLLAAHSALYVGLGGSFDVYTGRKQRAPHLMQRLGLEWFYRLLLEPRSRLPRQKPRLLFALRVLTNRL